jgi:drug/metabolite transporter (DMT)-like permease
VLTAAGVVFGFPLFTSVAMRYVEAVHAAVIIGMLPLATALVGALLHRQRPSFGFWLCGGLGSAFVVCFALLKSDTGLHLHPPTCCCWPPWPAPPSATATAHGCRSACGRNT